MSTVTAVADQRGQRRVRRLLWFLGAVGSIWFLSGYALDRMREARIRAVRDRREKDLLKSHFTSLLATISVTLYALLPTLSPQLTAAYPVEATSQAIQGLSNPVSSQASIDGRGEHTAPPSEASSSHRHQSGTHAAAGHEHGHGHLGESILSKDSTAESGFSVGEASAQDVPLSAPSESGMSSADPALSGVGESWASEFERRADHEEGQEVRSLSSDGGAEHSPATSTSMSLPPTDLPTDMSSTSGSPPSDMSMSAQLHPSPPRRRSSPPPPSVPELPVKSKKELWSDLKVQSLTRALTTAYVLPLLYILTSSQLSTLARVRYLEDVKSALPPSPDLPPAAVRQARRTAAGPRKSTSWIGSFSIESLGLSEFVNETTSLVPNPAALLPTAVSKYLPSWIRPSSGPSRSTMMEEEEEMLAQERQWQDEADRAEAERLYLSYSWWLLHEGWRSIAARVEEGVQRVFAAMPLKRELSVTDWDGLIREVRMDVETADGADLFDFTASILPPIPLPETSTLCPLPIAPPSEHLSTLLAQTRSHFTSPDGRYLRNKGVEAMVRRLLESLRNNLYEPPRHLRQDILPDVRSIEEPSASVAHIGDERKRLVDCLPEINRWGKGVWEGVPDGGVEALIALPEFESFAALVFGDWAPR